MNISKIVFSTFDSDKTLKFLFLIKFSVKNLTISTSLMIFILLTLNSSLKELVRVYSLEEDSKLLLNRPKIPLLYYSRIY